jgi:hypothetical protein
VHAFDQYDVAPGAAPILSSIVIHLSARAPLVAAWAIDQNRRYLWGSAFYWLCDCSGVKDILEYDGPIHQVHHWAQELFGYFFHVVHQPACMMADVEAFTHRYSPLITSY